MLVCARDPLLSDQFDRRSSRPLAVPCSVSRTKFEQYLTYLFTNAGQNDEEGHKESDEDDAKCDGGIIASHGRPVGAVVKCWSTVVAKRIEPAPHDAAATAAAASISCLAENFTAHLSTGCKHRGTEENIIIRLQLDLQSKTVKVDMVIIGN